MAKILAVDDQRTIRELVSVVLKAQGHQIETAADGFEALQLAKENKYDLIISDVNMPNMNGISFVAKVRKLLHLKYVPILMLTTESSDSIKTTARNSGASGWLTKPFDSRRLSGAVKKMLAKQES
ncbi:MAG: response regulator [Psychrosphaera sp.]|nr:response regulator [Psychrosphaera sp.]